MRRMTVRPEWRKMVDHDDEVSSDPITVRIDAASKLTGISRSQLYELIRAGRLDTVKVGKVNLIIYRSLKELLGQ